MVEGPQTHQPPDDKEQGTGPPGQGVASASASASSGQRDPKRRPQPTEQEPYSTCEAAPQKKPRTDDQRQCQPGIHQVTLFAKFLKHIVDDLDVVEDDQEEKYLDLKDVGFVNDQNRIERITSRETLWEKYPFLEGRLVILPFYYDIFQLADPESGNSVLITGTPGVGKSTLRTVHLHWLLRRARKASEPCRIILGKGGDNYCVVLDMLSDGTTRVTKENDVIAALDQPSVSDPGKSETEDVVLGKSCFVLVDVSEGIIGKFAHAGAGLVVYSSPSTGLLNNQKFKTKTMRLAFPLVEKDVLLRYKNEEMEKLFERFGGLPRLVWGSALDVAIHVGRLNDSLQDVESFLRTSSTENYLVGPHRFYYTDVKKNEEGKWIYQVDLDRPGVVPAPKHVMRIAAKKVVDYLLAPSVKASFGLDHKTVSGVLFEEVCFYLLEKHRERIHINVKSLTNKRSLANTKLVMNKKLQLGINLTRRVVKASDLVSNMDSCSAGDLVIPATPNYPGLDGILVLPASNLKYPAFWLYLQMRTSRLHAVADEGVAKFNELSEKAPQQGKAAKREALVFLVPGYHYDSFKEQKAKSKAKQRALARFSQYVMTIAIRD